MGQYRHHVFVCTYGKSCAKQGAERVHEALKKGIRDAGLKQLVRVNHAGCMNQCGHGPMVVVYPQDVWYARVTPRDAERIVRQHLAGEEPVGECVYRPRKKGDNKRD